MGNPIEQRNTIGNANKQSSATGNPTSWQTLSYAAKFHFG